MSDEGATGLLTERQLARMLGCSIAKLRNDRYAGRGIPFTRIGRLIRYQRASIDSYLSAMTCGVVTIASIPSTEG